MYGYNPNVWGSVDTGDQGGDQVSTSAQVTRYVEAYRRFGYKYANLNPVAAEVVAKGDIWFDNKW